MTPPEHAPAPGGPRTVDEHRAVVASLVPPAPVVEVPLSQALGRVLAADVVATVALPPFDNSAMDGYAVRAAEVAAASEDAPVALPVAEDIPAGRTDVPTLQPGTAHRIMTGAPMPAGADAVVQVELTDGGVEQVAVRRGPAAGTHVRRAGEDVRPGTTVLTAGTVLGPPQVGLLAAIGLPTVAVRRPPRVLVLSTGSELVEPGAPLAPGQIYESNGPMLAAAVREAGGEAELLRFVPDDVEVFASLLAEKAGDVDLILTSGGVSAGAYEVVKDALRDRGVEFVRVAMQPGGPQGAGRLDGDGPAVVTLPGNPVSSLVSFEVFVRPALRAAMGHPHPLRPVVSAALAEALVSPPDKRQFRRGVLDASDGTVAEVGAPASHLLASLALADCLIVVPEGVSAVDKGVAVEVWLLEA
ncbi:gephyrin-like molybdotransferase Glp [Pseudonocardia benzenivorans]|uniref:Molybdopterin molybdenumtransferase n=1 Tax=Pseudonocardia benzenivorans TaxID=228005 RepID=A0ABW3VNG2_9PSEU|nr:putative molybdopterin biosynthesis protein MoeA [Pseudonocardia sp. D17]